MTNTAIASTQKAGEGDATILGNNSRPIAENLLAQASQQAKAKATGDLLKQKGIQENQTKFFQNIAGLKDKVAYYDIQAIIKDVGDLIDYGVEAQKAGQSPYDPSSPAGLELYGKLAKLEYKAAASKSSEQAFKDFMTNWQTGRQEDFNQQEMSKIGQQFLNTPIEERRPEQLKMVYKPVDFTKMYGAMDKVFLPQMTALKSYYDQNQVDTANAQFATMKQNIPAYLKALASDELKLGITTEEEVDKAAQSYVDALQRQASLDPTKINQLDFQKTKEANLEAFRKAKLELEKGRLEVSQRNATTAEKKQASSETVPLDVIALLEQAKNGDVNAIKLLNAGNSYGGDVNSITKVVKGDGRKLVNPATGNTFIASPNMTFFELTDNNGKITYQATDEEALKGMANGSWGQGVNKATQIDATTQKNVKPIGLGTPKQSQVGSKSSTSSSTKNKTSSGNKVVTSGKVIIKKGYNPKTDQTQFIYSDGTKEIVNGKQ